MVLTEKQKLDGDSACELRCPCFDGLVMFPENAEPTPHGCMVRAYQRYRYPNFICFISNVDVG
jgi:hypothetical protein